MAGAAAAHPAGGSSGSAVWGALRWAERFQEPRDVVVILPDSGTRYLSKLYDDAWLRDAGHLDKGVDT